MPDPLDAVMQALTATVDRAAFAARLAQLQPKDAGSVRPEASGVDATARLMLSDILDDGILAARSGDKSFPLRLLLSEMATRLPTSDDAMALAGGLNLFFRAELDEEARVQLGVSISRAYYRFVRKERLDQDLVLRASPLLSQLMSTQVERVRFESVDHAPHFDSKDHERGAASNPSERKISHPESFLVRVSATGLVRSKALVST